MSNKTDNKTDITDLNNRVLIAFVLVLIAFLLTYIAFFK